jgi:hypothetical protein
MNGNTILSEDSPKQEAVVKISAVHALLSETRLLFCSRVVGPLKNKPQRKSAPNDDITAPPRLEALSRLIMRCLDVSVKSMRLSLLSDERRYPLTPGQKEIIMEESIGDFLSIASCFDLSFPNEDALSSAMQICIDRLVGLGIFPDDAWDCANSALVSFLDDEAHDVEQGPKISGENISSTSVSNGERGAGPPRSPVDKAIRNAVTKALENFPPPDDEMDPERQPLNNLLVIDMPGGAHVSSIQLFYDFHMAASLPTLFVTNTAGIHLFRIVPVESANFDGGVDHGSTSDNSEGDFGEPGFVFSRFVLDQEYPFGKGGLPLSVLGSDDGSGDAALRTREKMDDIQIGEFEVTYSHRHFEDMSKTISTLKNSFRQENGNSDDEEAQNTREVSPPKPIKSSLFVKSESVSVLFASDELVPFCRLRLDHMYLKKDGPPSELGARYVPLFRVVSRAFSLLNLTEEGQFYPDAISSVFFARDMTTFPVQIDFEKHAPPWQLGSRLKIVFRGFRIFLVRQFINELLQYMLSEYYGVGKWKHGKKMEDEAKPQDPTQRPQPPLSYKIHILDSSLILPRSRFNHDMAAIEVSKGLIFNTRHPGTFRMPTQTTEFKPFPEPTDHDATPVENGVQKLISRMNFHLHKMRIFSSLGEEKSGHSDPQSPIFRFFYEIVGRAEDHAWVYCKQPDIAEEPPEELVPAFDALNSRRWKEITTGNFSLDVLVDYAPNLRVLISEPLAKEDFLVAPRLDVRLSQFCLLLSIWYDNMQELPVIFPYLESRIMQDSRSLLWRTVPAEFGTKEYLAVWDDFSCVKTEICVMLRNLALRCIFDCPGYFEQEPEIQRWYENPDNAGKPFGVQIYFTDCVVHTFSDLRGMMRIGCAAAGFDLIDERRSRHCQRTFSVSKNSLDRTKMETWADLSWGLYNDVKGIDKTLPQPFQLSVYMTKDWSLINLGLEVPNSILFEFSPIWFFLGFFCSYYQEAAYGNPGYPCQGEARKLKDILGSAKKIHLKDPEGLNIDFRLWLSKPHLVLPCDLIDPRAPSLRIESRTGLWYHFKKIKEFKSQEVVSTGLDLVFANEFLAPRQSYDSRDTMVRHLVEGLSFALRLDKNQEDPKCVHTDYALQIPYDPNRKADCSLTSHGIQVAPIILDSPTICTPVEIPTRCLGPHVCEITCIVEVLPLASSVLVNLFTGPVEVPDEDDPPQEEEKSTFSFSGDIRDLRLFAVDPVLGVQLPVAVISISSVILTASQLSSDKTSSSRISRGDSPPEDLHVAVDCHLWGDYFKLGVTRSWEPLLEPYRCVLLYEKSKYRGKGMSLNADCPLHINVSGALLLIIDEVIDSFSRTIKEAFGGSDPEQDLERVMPRISLLGQRMIVEEKVRLRGDQELVVVHDIPKPLLDDRVAFSLSNLTGQKMRIHQQEDLMRGTQKEKPTVVTYLNHDEATSLSFDATISVVKNLAIVEVPYPGLPASQNMNRAKRSAKHAVDVQIPGFRWVQGIKVDTFGRKFESLRPRSSDLLAKVTKDWRIENALQLLVEVGLDNGGRLVTVRSLFEVRNNTTHPLALLLHPDPQYNVEGGGGSDKGGSPEAEAISVVEPGEFYQIPTILLESGLHMGGSHLGSLWVKPDSHDEIAIPSLIPGIGHEGSGETNFTTSFCSRPVQLAKVVHESALMFENNDGSEIAPEQAKSGVQISCPVKSVSGDSLAPFCYAIEVGRSPIVPAKQRTSGTQSAVAPDMDVADIHGPVAYTLSVHAPFVIANLLPETGRFELMHAVRRTVLWYGDLKPGQQVPVHCVGLDAPLLLLLNLGFCRTPVGEGALVHHGADTVAGSKGMLLLHELLVTKSCLFSLPSNFCSRLSLSLVILDNLNLKTLVGKSAGAVGKVVTKSTGAVGKVVTKSTGAVGKVVTKGTKQIGKTLTVLSDSPDKRTLQDVADADGQDVDALHSQLESGEALPIQATASTGASSMGFDTGSFRWCSLKRIDFACVISAYFQQLRFFTSFLRIKWHGQFGWQGAYSGE